MRLVLIATFAFLVPGVAFAGPGFVAPFLGGFFATAFGKAVLQIGLGLVINAISGAIARKNQRSVPSGIRAESPTSGESTPQTIIVGRYATSGNLAAPFMTHELKVGSSGYTTHGARPGSGRYRTQVYDLSDYPIEDLEAVIINGKTFDMATDMVASGLSYGDTPATGDYAGKLYVKWYDGTQIAADPMLLDVYGAHPTRPWTVDHVGKGVAYAILTLEYDQKLWQGDPKVRFVVKGAPLYDPRTATTAHTENPMVIAWNLFRGITLEDGQVYGLGVEESALPSSWWFAAMNDCDADRGDTLPIYRTGYEIKMANPDFGGDFPLDILGILSDACSAEYCDLGGQWIVRVGEVQAGIVGITDNDLVRTESHSYDPHPPLDGTINAVHAQYPSASAGWETREAPPLYNATFESEDGGKRYIAEIALPGVWDDTQAQYLMYAYLNDARKKRQHVEVLPPEYGYLTPLDAILRSSVVHGYTGKVFEIGKLVENPENGTVAVHHRERDAADYDLGSFTGTGVTNPSSEPFVPSPVSFDSYSVTASAIYDSSGIARRPSIVVSWSIADPESADWIQWVLTDSMGNKVGNGYISDLAAGVLVITEGLLASQNYTFTATLVSRFGSTSPGPTAVTTLAIALTDADFDPSFDSYVTDIAASTLSPLELENMNVVEIVDLGPEWNGTSTFSGVTPGTTEIKNGDLYVTPGEVDQQFIYTDNDAKDLGAALSVRILSNIDRFFWDSDYTWDTWGTWDSVGLWAGTVLGKISHIEIRTTLDDPASPSATWSAWGKPVAELIKTRGVEFRVVAQFGPDLAQRLRISTAVIVIDVPDRTVSEKNLSIPAAGLDYSFSPPFLDIPAVVASMTDPADGHRLKISAVTADGVRLDVLNAAGTGVAGDVNMLAKGFGRKEV